MLCGHKCRYLLGCGRVGSSSGAVPEDGNGPAIRLPASNKELFELAVQQNQVV